MELGFMGLGQMGKPIALNLLKGGGGADLAVLARRDEHLAEFRARGARASKDPGDLAGADILFLCLPDGSVVRDALFGGAAPLADKLRRGSAVVDLSTITYGDAIDIDKRLDERGIAFLDAPISGMEARAVEGTLTVMCGGEREVFDRARPYLDCIGNKILHMGPTGSGQLTKLINQLLFDINAAALGRNPAHGREDGPRPRPGGRGGQQRHRPELRLGVLHPPHPRRAASPTATRWPAPTRTWSAPPSSAAGLCIPMPVLAAATATYQAALLRGHGEKDKGGMIRVFEELLGVRVPHAATGRESDRHGRLP